MTDVFQTREGTWTADPALWDSSEQYKQFQEDVAAARLDDWIVERKSAGLSLLRIRGRAVARIWTHRAAHYTHWEEIGGEHRVGDSFDDFDEALADALNVFNAGRCSLAQRHAWYW